MKIEISRISEKDTDELYQLFDNVIKDNFLFEGYTLESLQDGIQQCINQPMEGIKSDFESEGKDNYHLIAKINGKIIGTMAHGTLSETVYKNTSFKNGIREIKSAYILPDYQNKGVGSILLNAILLSLYQTDIKKVCIYSGFKKGIAFWEKKFGKAPIILKDYFDKDVDCLIWHKELKDIIIEYNVK